MDTRWSGRCAYSLFSENGRRHHHCAAVLFFLSAYVLFRSRRFLLQLVKDFLLHRERTSIFATSTAGDMRYLLLLILQTCILSGVCIFNYCNDIQPELVHHVPPFALLGLYIGISLLYLFLKWILYSVLGWIFLTKVLRLSGLSHILPCFIILVSLFSRLCCLLFISI